MSSFGISGNKPNPNEFKIGKFDDGVFDLADDVTLIKKENVASKESALNLAKRSVGSELVVEKNEQGKGLSYDVYSLTIKDSGKKLNKLQDVENLKLFDRPLNEIEKKTGTSNIVKANIVTENGEVSKPIYNAQFNQTKYDKTRDALNLDASPKWAWVVEKAMSTSSPSDSLAPLDRKELNNLKSHIKPGDILLNGNDGSFIHGILYVGKDPDLQAQLEKKWDLPKGALKDDGMIIHSLIIDDDTTVEENGKKNTYKAGGTGVILDTIEQYTSRHPRDVLVAVQVKGSSDQDRQSAINAAKGFVGKAYDKGFNTYDDKEMYCTETVMKAWLNSSNPPKFDTQKHALFPYPEVVLNNVPEKMAKIMKDDGRLHQEMIMTDGIATSPSTEVVWASQNADKSEFFKKHDRWADGAEGKMGDDYKKMVMENMPQQSTRSRELTDKIKILSERTRNEMK